MILAELGRCPEAIADADRAIARLGKIAPTGAELATALEARGRCLLASHPARALADLEREGALLMTFNDDPHTRAQAHAYLGLALVRVGARGPGLAMLRQVRPGAPLRRPRRAPGRGGRSRARPALIAVEHGVLEPRPPARTATRLTTRAPQPPGIAPGTARALGTGHRAALT